MIGEYASPRSFLIMAIVTAIASSSSATRAEDPSGDDWDPESEESDALDDDKVDSCDEDFPELEEGAKATTAIDFEQEFVPGQPSFELACAGTTLEACGGNVPFVCGVSGIRYFSVSDEMRPTIVIRSNQALKARIGERDIVLKPACPPRRTAPVCNTYEGRATLNLKRDLSLFKTITYGAGVEWTQPFELRTPNGELVARGEVTLDEFNDIAERLSLGAASSFVPHKKSAGLVVFQDSNVVGTLPEATEAPLLDYRHMANLTIPVTDNKQCDAEPAPLAPRGKALQAISGARLSIQDRSRADPPVVIELPPLPAGSPCPPAYASPRWFIDAYRDFITQEFLKLSPANQAATPAAIGPLMPLGLSALTVDALAAKLGGVRAHLAAVLGNKVGGLNVTARMGVLTRMAFAPGIDLATLEALGADLAVAKLIGATAEQLEAMVGKPRKQTTSSYSKKDDLYFSPVAGGLGFHLKVTIDKGRIVSVVATPEALL